jgi:hypothetical protein
MAPMMGPMRSTRRRCPGWGGSRPMSAVRSRSCQCQPAATLESRQSGPLGTWANVGSAPFPGGGRGSARPATGLAARGRGCGPRAYGPCRGPGGLVGVDDGGVVVVVAGAHVLPLLAMPQILGDVGMLVLVQLGVMAVGVGYGEPPPAWACLPEPTQVAGPGSPAVDRQVDRQPPDDRGSWRTPLDDYTHSDLRGCGWRCPTEQLTSPRVKALD